MELAYSLVITLSSRLILPSSICSKASSNVMILVILAGHLRSVAFSSKSTWPVDASIRIADGAETSTWAWAGSPP